MRKSTSLARCSLTLVLLGALAPATPAHLRAHPDDADAVPTWKLAPGARDRAAARGKGWSRVIVSAADSTSAPRLRQMIERTGGTAGRHLRLINSQAAYVPDAALNALAKDPSIARVSLDRPVIGAMARTSKTVRATDVRKDLGYDGSGVGVAIIDSGVAPSNADLAAPDGAERVIQFVDFVNLQTTPYDDYGHGTHVAGIIAGNGTQSGGSRSGIAPGARLIVLKALDESGGGFISNVIAALDYAVANKDALNIRVVNLSLATGVHESYNTDPLALATRRAVQAGLVVVASAGNVGRDPMFASAYAGITAPGNAPWVLTVGASNHMGTDDRSDDTIAAFSSRGPTAIDYLAKPDLVAPGVGIESLSAPGSLLYARLSPYLLPGNSDSPTLPYLSLTGTSMSAPVVSGAVALMLQANPALTPNEVKAILQYTARTYGGLDGLTQGAGFLNVKGAVELARYFAAVSNGEPSATYPWSWGWSGRIVWGNQLIRGGRLTPSATAWSTDVTWGAAFTPTGTNVSWGDICSDHCSDEGAVWTPWATSCTDATCTAVTWGAGTSRNLVWDSTCGGADCQGAWTLVAAGSTISDLTRATTVVWGSDDGSTVLWGSTVVWGTRCTDPACEPVIWNKE